MNKVVISAVLLEAARRAAENTTATHPVDIAHAMMNAIEYGAEVIDILNKGGRFK